MRATFKAILAAAPLLAACSDDSLSSSGATDSTTTTSSTAPGTGGSGGTTGSTDTGGTGGGSGGVVSTGGSGGTPGTGGSGGLPGTGGTGGIPGTGGSGGMTGTGGSGGGASGTLLVVAGGLPDSLAVAASWTASTGWSKSNINLQFKEAALARTDTGALFAARRLSNDPPMGEDELYHAAWTPGAGFGAVQSLGASAKDGPALAPHGVATMLAALDLQNKHVYSQYESGAFGAIGPIPAGMPGTQAFGPSGPALVAFGAAGVYASYSGDNEQLYMSVKSGPGGIWTPSQLVPTSAIVNAHTPALAVDSADDLHLFYVRKSDGRVCTVTLMTPQNSWSDEEAVHQDAITGQSPAAALLAGGDLLVAWHGFNNNGIYFSRRTAGVWSAPVTVEEPAMPSSGPVVVAGLGGADAEILYTAGAKLRWARVDGTTATFGDDPAVANVSALAALVVP